MEEEFWRRVYVGGGWRRTEYEISRTERVERNTTIEGNVMNEYDIEYF